MTTMRATAMAATMALGCAALGCGSDDGGGKGGGTGGTAAAGGTGGTGGVAGSGGSAGLGVGGSMGCSVSPRSLWTWDLGVMPPQDIQVEATCRAETAHVYVYVADSVWGSDVTQEQVTKVAEAFDQSTLADPAQGIYALDTDTFGDPPDVDGDPHTVLFYAPMNPYKGYTFDGFFRAEDEKAGAASNQMEMLHLNSSGTKSIDSEYMLGVVAHELVHLINWNYDKSEEGWLDESLAEIAMVRAGYMTDLPAAKSYVKSTADTPLLVASYSDYGADFAWGTYLYDRFGKDFVRTVAQDPSDGRASVEAHLPGGGKFRDVFGEFMVAALLDQPDIGDGRFGFKSWDASGLGSESAGQLDGVEHEIDSVAFGARTLRLTPSGAGTVSVTLTSTELAKLVVHSVVLDPAKPEAAKVTVQASSDVLFTIPVSAGEVVDLVVAVDAGAALSSGDNPPLTKIGYTASYAP